jgi:hypothetical protein
VRFFLLELPSALSGRLVHQDRKKASHTCRIDIRTASAAVLKAADQKKSSAAAAELFEKLSVIVYHSSSGL